MSVHLVSIPNSGSRKWVVSVNNLTIDDPTEPFLNQDIEDSVRNFVWKAPLALSFEDTNGDPVTIPTIKLSKLGKYLYFEIPFFSHTPTGSDISTITSTTGLPAHLRPSVASSSLDMLCEVAGTTQVLFKLTLTSAGLVTLSTSPGTTEWAAGSAISFKSQDVKILVD